MFFQLALASSTHIPPLLILNCHISACILLLIFFLLISFLRPRGLILPLYLRRFLRLNDSRVNYPGGHGLFLQLSMLIDDVGLDYLNIWYLEWTFRLRLFGFYGGFIIVMILNRGLLLKLGTVNAWDVRCSREKLVLRSQI